MVVGGGGHTQGGDALYSMVLWFGTVHGPGGSSKEVPHQMDPGHSARCPVSFRGLRGAGGAGHGKVLGAEEKVAFRKGLCMCVRAQILPARPLCAAVPAWKEHL